VLAFAAAALLALVIAAVPLAGLAHQNLNASGGSIPVWVAAAFGVVGLVLAWRRPANPVGWIMLGGAVFGALSEDASFYSVADYRLRHGGLPFGWVAQLAQPGWAPAIMLFGLVVVLFPDGRLPSPRWRWPARGYVAAGLLWIAGALVTRPPAGGTWCRWCSSPCWRPAGSPRWPARCLATGARPGNAASS
jgi:hypothetical protein